MNKIRLLLLSSIFFSTLVTAFPCYVTLVKDNCWTNYDVTVKINDTSKDKVVATVFVPAGKQWARVNFQCQPRETFIFLATYSPVFWAKEEDVVYQAKRYWSLPETIVGDTEAWNMNICYAADFSAVPLPPDASGACQCDMTKIPAVKL